MKNFHVIFDAGAWKQKCSDAGTGRGGAGGPLALPIFGRSVNPIPTGVGQIMPTITTGPPKVFHLPAPLQAIIKRRIFKKTFLWPKFNSNSIQNSNSPTFFKKVKKWKTKSFTTPQFKTFDGGDQKPEINCMQPGM